MFKTRENMFGNTIMRKEYKNKLRDNKTRNKNTLKQ